MTNHAIRLEDEVRSVLADAWDESAPDPGQFDKLSDSWFLLGEESRRHLVSVVTNVVRDLRDRSAETTWKPVTSIESIKPGSKIKMDKPGQVITFKERVKSVDDEYDVIWFTNGDAFAWVSDQQVIYMQPPEHPDPELHPVITIKAINGEPIDGPGSAMFWGGHYRYGCNEMTIAEDITEWEPAEVVPK